MAAHFELGILTHEQVVQFASPSDPPHCPPPYFNLWYVCNSCHLLVTLVSERDGGMIFLGDTLSGYCQTACMTLMTLTNLPNSGSTPHHGATPIGCDCVELHLNECYEV